MPRATLSVQDITTSGLVATYANGDAANGHQFANDGDVFLHVKNGGTAAITVTVPTPAKVSGLDVADVSVSVGAGGEAFIGPFDPTLFNQSGGVTYVNLSADTSVTLAALRLKR